MIVLYVQVVVMEVKDLSCLSPNKIVYCTMEVDGGDKLQTDQAEASKPWSLCLLFQSTLWYIQTWHLHNIYHPQSMSVYFVYGWSAFD